MAVEKRAAKPRASTEELLKYYREMLLIRRFEEKSGQLYGMGKIGGFCHLYIGQEAVVTGLEAAAADGDKRITAYRDHGHMLACGMDPKGVMAELTGRFTGYSRGKGGSMHMFSKERAFFGGHGIVGAQVPIGAGLAFSDRFLETGKVTFTYLVTVQQTRAKCMKHLTWPAFGNSPYCLSSRTIAMQWGPPFRERLRPPNCTLGDVHSAFRASP